MPTQQKFLRDAAALNLSRGRPNSRATRRTRPCAQAAPTLCLSSVTLAELLLGIAALPFDTDAAKCYAKLAVMARTGGRGFPTSDGYIAAIAAGVPLINPWEA